jgi:hypothetical protein
VDLDETNQKTLQNLPYYLKAIPLMLLKDRIFFTPGKIVSGVPPHKVNAEAYYFIDPSGHVNLIFFRSVEINP